jgi:hypothetical protein
LAKNPFIDLALPSLDAAIGKNWPANSLGEIQIFSIKLLLLKMRGGL